MRARVAVFVLCMSLTAGGTRASENERRFVELDVFQLEFASDPQISPDGSQIGERIIPALVARRKKSGLRGRHGNRVSDLLTLDGYGTNGSSRPITGNTPKPELVAGRQVDCVLHAC